MMTVSVSPSPRRSDLRPRLRALSAAVLIAMVASACGSHRGLLPNATPEADKYLYERGTELLTKKKWIAAREYFKQVVDNYPQSPFRPDAKLGLGDTYVGENTTEALVLGINEFREFLTYYPTNRRADYAQFKIGHAHFKQALAPERDQTETKEALKEFDIFIERYPNSQLLDEARQARRDALDRLGEADYRVGLFYYRAKWYPGAIDRFKDLLKKDPQYTGRDATYYYLAESLVKVERAAEALPYFERLLQEFESSQHLENTRKRIAELKAAAPATPATPK